MVQLRVDNIFLDLYEEETIKLNFSIEDITDAQARSIFSRSFRVPATSHNQQFFKTAFMVNGVDFDVTKRYSATVLVDGNEFRDGQLRLEKIFNNGAGYNVDYQCLFLGETRNFGSAVGESTLCQLDLSHLAHDFTLDNIELSWQAYPEGATLTDGLLNGDVLYPLIDHGNSYDDDGMAEQPKIAAAHGGAHHSFFTTDAIQYTRLKPMVRTKAILDQIFDQAGFTYQSDFLNSDDFKATYVSAFGNEQFIDIPLGSANMMKVQMYIEKYLNVSLPGTIPYDLVVQDPGDNFNDVNYSYTIPVDLLSYQVGPGNYPKYKLRHYTTMKFAAHPSGTSTAAITVRVTYTQQATGNSYTLTTSTGTTDSGLISYHTVDQLDVNVNSALYFASGNGAPGTVTDIKAGDYITVTYIPTNCFFLSVLSSYLWITETPGEMNPSQFFDCDYKQIDFVKDVLTKFRLVMSPSRLVPNQFVIEPWSNFIATGDYFDWTDKVDIAKDMVIEPTFYSQSAKIVFEDTADGDWVNQLNVQQFKETFGTLKVESGNELLTGTRNIKTNFAASPITRMEGTSSADNTPLLQLHTHSAEDTGLQHLSIKPITRILYYNGLHAFTVGGVSDTYYICSSPQDADYDPACPNSTGDGRGYQYYSLVSPHQDWPTQSNSIDLNWQLETGYTGQSILGRSCYDQFWAQYIDNLYDPAARTVTYYIELNNVDLQDFSFDDIVFIKDTYYYVQQITDAPIGTRATVKVDLVKLLDTVLIQNAPPPPTQEPWNSIAETYNTVDDKWNVK